MVYGTKCLDVDAYGTTDGAKVPPAGTVGDHRGSDQLSRSSRSRAPVLVEDQGDDYWGSARFAWVVLGS